MSKQKNKKKNRRGFTLAEVLVAVTLIIILSGLGIIEVVKYQRNLKQLERDGIAKEIFVAAQNNLSLAVSQGYLQRDDFGTSEGDTYSSPDTYYMTSDSLGTEGSVLGLMLPQNSIDETVRAGGSYIIRYQKASGRVLDVFYAEPEGKFPIKLIGDLYDDLMGKRGEENKEARRVYGSGKAVVGYYGGVTGAAVAEAVDLVAPTVEVINAEKLSVIVTAGDTTGITVPLMYRLIITGEQSGASLHFDSTAATNPLTLGTPVVLDDITSSGGHFADNFAGFIPGENLLIKAQVCALSDGIITQTADSVTKKTNSLFADLKKVTSGGVTSTLAVVSNMRHLENLGESISGFSGVLGTGEQAISVSGAVQTTDLSWPEFCQAVSSTPGTVNVYSGANGSGNGLYAPVSPNEALDYDGGGYKITGVKTGVAASGAGSGLFGTLKSGSSVENLFLVDFDIHQAAGDSGDAGALAGSIIGTDVYGVLAYNDTKSSSDDSALSINSASGNAGGLIGSMTGGSITGSAAAVYVKGGNYAGGLVGSASGAVVIDSCYAGGHTENARFTENLTGTDKVLVNVQGKNGAGGLIGSIEGDTGAAISYSYSTCSVYTETGYAGGLSGTLTDTAVTDCYSASRVLNNGNTDCYVGNGGGTLSGKNYYLTNLSPRVPSATTATGVSGKDKSYPDFIFVGDDNPNRQGAYIYDDTLKVEYGGRFYFPTVKQLGGTVIEGITDCHYGDWQVPFLDTLSFEFINKDKLYLDIIPDERLDEKKSFIIILSGLTSGKDVLYQVDVTDMTHPKFVNQGTIVIDDRGTTDTADDLRKVTWPAPASVGNPLPISYAEDTDGTKHIKVILDDITAAGSHFSQLLNGTGLIPGENIKASIAIGNGVSDDEISELTPETQNSLFALGTNGSDPAVSSGLDTGNAVIAYTRHLQNLDTSVSNVDSRIVRAYLNNDLPWDPAVYTNIYSKDSTALAAGKFYGINNANLTLFEGRNCNLIGFDFSGAGAQGAGLFRLINSGMTIQNLGLKNCKANVNGYAGLLAAQVSAGSKVTVNTVRAYHASDAEASGAAVTSTGTSYAAGGLIGHVESDLDLINSSASVLVTADGSAGGLIGETGAATVTMDSCYSGGHTESGKYAVSAADVYNIQSLSGNAGGIVGTANGSSLWLARTFGAASVSAKSGAAGGLLGDVSGASVSFNMVYSVAPVWNVKSKKNMDGSSLAGALVGKAGTIADGGELSDDDPSVFFLPELYVGNDDLNDLDSVYFVGTGLLERGAAYAYYQRNENGILIAAKDHAETMQYQTVPYDGSLGTNIYGSNYEYPFSIWTSFPKKESGDYFLGTYVGDWEPIVAAQTVSHNIIFSYDDSVRGVTVDLAEEPLGTQSVLDNVVNSILVPSTPYYPGKSMRWELVDDSGITWKGTTAGEQQIAYKNGTITIPKAAFGSDIYVKGSYVTDKTKNLCSLIFEYDKTGANTTFEQLGSVKQVTTGTTWGSLMGTSAPGGPLVEPRTINDYDFVDWYKDKGFTTPWKDTDTINGDVFAYAKYEKLEFYNVKIDFLYEIVSGDGSVITGSMDVPRYSIDDAPQFRITQPKNRTYDGDITLPEGVKDKLGATKVRIVLTEGYEKDEAGQKIPGTQWAWVKKGSGSSAVIDEKDWTEISGNTCRIKAQDESRYQVIYTIPAEKAKVNLAFYRIIHRLNHTDPATGKFAPGTWVDNVETNIPYKDTYPDGEETWVQLEIAGTEKEAQVVPPVVQFTTENGFACQTKQEDIKPENTAIFYESNRVENGDYIIRYFDIVLTYERKTQKLYFNTAGGSYISPKEYYIGQPLPASVSAAHVENPTRNNYDFDKWSNLYKKGNEASTISWGTAMPDYNLEVKASWNRNNIPYTIMIWRQKVSDDRNAQDIDVAAGRKRGDSGVKDYDFVVAYKNTAANKNTVVTIPADYTKYADFTNTGKGQEDYHGFHYNATSSDKGGVTVNPDGSTVFNIYYDRNVMYMDFSNATLYDPLATATAEEITTRIAGGEKFYGYKEGDEYTNQGTVELLFWPGNEAGKQWGYQETITVTDYTGEALFAGTKFFSIATDNDGTQYSYDYQELERKKVSGVRNWYYKGTNNRYDGTRYKTSTLPDIVTNTTIYYLSPDGTQIWSNSIGTSQALKKKEDGRYYLYNVSTHTEYVDRYSNPTTTRFWGLYGQPISRYGYQWPVHWMQTTMYYTDTSKKSGKAGNNLTYLGQFKFPDFDKSGDNKDDTYLVATRGSQTDNKIYFVKQNEDGQTYPIPYDSVKDVGNSSGSLNYSEKFEGFHYAQYTNEAANKDTNSSSSTSGIWNNITATSNTLKAVRFARLSYPVKIYYGYITPNDGIIFPDFGSEQNKTKVGTTIYSKSGWSYSEIGHDTVLNSNDKYYTYNYGYSEKTVPANKQLRYDKDAWYLFDAGQPQGTFSVTTNRLYDTVVDKNLLVNIGIPDTLTVSGTQYTIDAAKPVYVDNGCENLFSGSDRVPTAALQYFVCYTPPYQKVNFTLYTPQEAIDEGKAAGWATDVPVEYSELKVKTDPVSNPGIHTIEALKGFSLDGYVTNANGDLISWYTPQLEGYDFDCWIYTDSTGEHEFYSSLPIDGDITLTPRWIRTAPEERIQNRLVYVYHYEVDDTGSKVKSIFNLSDKYDPATKLDYQIMSKPAGKSASFESLNFDEYYPLASVQQKYIEFTDKDPATEIITVEFLYKKVTPWKYAVEYKVRYKAFDSTEGITGNYGETAGVSNIAGLIGTNMSGSATEYLPLGSTTVANAYSEYQSVVFELPEGFGAYNLDKIDFIKWNSEGAAETQPITDNSYVVINRGAAYDLGGDLGTVDAKVVFYLEPDPTAIMVGDRFAVYNGETAAHIVDEEPEKKTYKAPAGYQVDVKQAYCFLDAEGKKILSDNQVVDSGSYKMNGFVVLELAKTTAGGAIDSSVPVKKFLLYKDVSRTLNLRITPRPLTLESASGTQGFSQTSPLKRSDQTDVTVTGPEDGYGGFIGDQGATYYFSVDAFRLEPGTTDNAFTYELWSDDLFKGTPKYTNPANYQITVKYGTLTVN